MNLRELQLQLRAAILQHEVPAALDPAPARHYAERFPVYTDGYRIRLTEALRANYPVLYQVLGDEAFDALALEFLAAEPSTTPSIRWFGARLPDYVRRVDEALPHPALVDLVAFEWALGTAFDAPDAPAVDPAALVATPATEWHALHFALHPSATVLTLDWAIEPIVRLLKDDPDAETPEPVAARHAVLTWRRGLEAMWRTLDDDEAAALHALAGGASFGASCERLAADHDPAEAARAAAAMLAGWVRDQVVTPSSLSADASRT